MTAVNPVFMNPALASLVEFEFGAENTLESLDRVVVRWRSGATEIGQERFRASSASSIQALAQRLVIGPGWESVGGLAFQGWSSATSLTLPASLTTVGNQAFQGWSSALELTLPASLTSVSNAFQGWSSATSLTLAPGHPGLINLLAGNNSPFRDWTALATIDLPTTIATLTGGLTHTSMTALETIIMRAPTPPTINTATFAGAPATARFYVPDASVDDYKAAPIWSTYAARIHPLSELP